MAWEGLLAKKATSNCNCDCPVRSVFWMARPLLILVREVSHESANSSNILQQQSFEHIKWKLAIVFRILYQQSFEIIKWKLVTVL